MATCETAGETRSPRVRLPSRLGTAGAGTEAQRPQAPAQSQSCSWQREGQSPGLACTQAAQDSSKPSSWLGGHGQHRSVRPPGGGDDWGLKGLRTAWHLVKERRPRGWSWPWRWTVSRPFQTLNPRGRSCGLQHPGTRVQGCAASGSGGVKSRTTVIEMSPDGPPCGGRGSESRELPPEWREGRPPRGHRSPAQLGPLVQTSHPPRVRTGTRKLHPESLYAFPAPAHVHRS